MLRNTLNLAASTLFAPALLVEDGKIRFGYSKDIAQMLSGLPDRKSIELQGKVEQLHPIFSQM